MTSGAPGTGDGTYILIVHLPSRISVDLEHQSETTTNNMLTRYLLCTLVKELCKSAMGLEM